MNKMFVFVYFGIQTRAVPWLLGVLLGYGIFNLKEQRCQLSKVTLHTYIGMQSAPLRSIFLSLQLTVMAGWVCSLITVLAIIFGPYEAQQILAKNDVLDNAFYGSLSRIGWSLCVIWLIFACHQGYGGLLDSFLSYSIWNVLGRFTYAIYVTHPTIQLSVIGSSRDCEVVGTYESVSRNYV